MRIRRIVFGIALVALCVTPVVAQASQAGQTLMSELHIPLEKWWKSTDDRLIVDTENNIGYIVKRSGVFTSFKVVTGQNRTVHYIGRTYRASTPARDWVAVSKINKGDKTTYGRRGLFIRLAYNNEDTPYGIHSHKSVEEMLARDDRYASMGCIIVSEEILALIESTFDLNGGTLQVTTIRALPLSLASASALTAAQ